MSVLMTDAAKQHISRQIQQRGKGIGIRVGVKTAGCSGLSYVLEFVDDLSAADTAFDQGDFNLIVDPKSLLYLDGTELDFVKEGLNEGFQFNNPNVKSECGCGESFHV
jgi:iron-sulfur cluster assembly protein